MAKVNVKAALMKAAASGAGAIAGASLNKISFVGTQQPLIRGLIKIGVGVMLPAFLGKGKSAGLIADVSAGILSIGAVEVANATVFKNSKISIAGPNSPWSALGIGGALFEGELHGSPETAYAGASRY